jgi:molybdenum cofactor cytidylyltransferase
MSAEKNKEERVGIILLAAGGSSRLGQPKQLLPYKGQTLLQNTLSVALTSNAQSVMVVLGASADILKKEITNSKIHVVVNDDWQEGMASSIRTGIKAITEISPSIEGIILLVCDQPFINSALLNNLITAHQKTGKEIVACTYGNTFGPPVFFHQSLFPELLQLEGDTGARSIVQKHLDNMEAIPFPEGIFDIDTEGDYEKIKGSAA